MGMPVCPWPSHPRCKNPQPTSHQAKEKEALPSNSFLADSIKLGGKRAFPL